MKEKETLRKIPTKNYVILCCLFLGFILLVMYLCNWYKVYSDYMKTTPVIRGTLSEIKSEELSHYIMENPTKVIYLCTSSDDVCRSFEEEFKDVVIKEGWKESITYLNLSDVDQDQFVDEFNNSYPYRVPLNKNYPAFIIFENEQIVDVLQGSVEDTITIDEVKQFLKMHRIGEVE